MHQAGALRRQIGLFIFITLLVLGGGSRTQAEVIFTCAQFAATYCDGAPVAADTRVSGGSAAVPSCIINIAAGVPLKFKNPGNPQACLEVEGVLLINGGASSSLRIEHTTIEVTDDIDIVNFSLTKVEGSTLSSGGRIRIFSNGTNAPVTVEDSTLTANNISILSFGPFSPVLVKDTTPSDTIGPRKLVLQAHNDIRFRAFGAGSAVDVKGGTLSAPSITVTTQTGSLLAVTGAELTADFTEIGSDRGATDAVDNIKGNTFGGGDVTIHCPARVTANTFTLSGDLSIAGSSPCTCSKNTPNVVCPTPP